MKRNKTKILSILLVILSVILIGINANAHSGRKDSNGGHKDTKNKSGLGSYHYHCGGNPAHLHQNGKCPYSSSASSNKNSKQSTSSSKNNTQSTSSVSKSTSKNTSTQNKNSVKTSTSSKSTTTTVSSNIEPTDIKINERIENIEEGKSEILTTTITPSNATNQNITWKSSDETILTINSEGTIVAKRTGIVDITATTYNGKTSTIKINVTEKQKNENSDIVKTSSTTVKYNTTNNINNNTTTSQKEKSSHIGEILSLGLIGGGSFGGYKIYKKFKQ